MRCMKGTNCLQSEIHFQQDTICEISPKKKLLKPINCFLQNGAIAIGVVIKCRFYTEDEFNRR